MLFPCILPKFAAMSEELENDKEMSFIGHLEELRWRLVRSSIAIVIGAIVVFIFTDYLVTELYSSMRHPDFITYRALCKISETLGMGNTLCAQKIDIDNLQSIGVTDQFTTHMFFALAGGVIVAFPFIVYQLWNFVQPALKSKEKKNTRGMVFYISLLFFLGVLFGYFVISPLAIQFFGNYKLTDVSNQFTLSSYMNTITKTTFFTGLLFQLPVVVYVLSKIGIITPAFLKKYRKHSIVAVLILAAIITPPDVVSQVLVAIPIMILYEISINISARIERQRNKR